MYGQSPPPYSPEAPPSAGPVRVVIQVPGRAVQHTVQHPVQKEHHGSSQPIVISITEFGPYSQLYACPHCGASIMTVTRPQPGLLTYVLSGTLLLFGWYLFCCFVPCCIRQCQDIVHFCPKCKSELGLHKRI